MNMNKKLMIKWRGAEESKRRKEEEKGREMHANSGVRSSTKVFTNQIYINCHILMIHIDHIHNYLLPIS